MPLNINPILPLAPLAMVLAACGSGGGGGDLRPGEVPSFDQIGEDEVISVAGTEPFWAIRIEGSMLTYSNPENIAGDEIAIERFAGNGGLGISGQLGDVQLQLAITPGDCSDGMSDRIYPYTATLALDGEILAGCAYTDRQGFKGEENP